MSLSSTFFVLSHIVHEFVHKQFFFLSSACLSNKPKTKVQVWLIYKQTNMNELIIEPSLNCLWTIWFVYNPSSLSYFTQILNRLILVIFGVRCAKFNPYKFMLLSINWCECSTVEQRLWLLADVCNRIVTVIMGHDL